MTITARCADERFHFRRVSQSPFPLDQIVGFFTELVHHRYLLKQPEISGVLQQSQL